ncbi:hypothetical protein DFH05DRAFT_1508887 [Lentinula detonsa]|uniref:Phospholipid/glycerol acyltransferase domain-containing protein n=1 Tax=Lentinula detonsa TaxID=2804962 RepID=A0A9W8TUH9_9AGAR|nr:hypothetical protein DFH05DRAFT_1508887 [Lentinula detonsa]
MELQLVYRILRKISDWSVTGYYSEILVEGSENVLNIQHDSVDAKRKDTINGPVILCSTHHNEMIDIATLAMTMPKYQGERRHVCFWAKESMFKNIIGGWIMRSSGAIAVKRNPNNSESGGLTEKEKLGEKDNEVESLFASTTRALTLHKVVGVFPEGTSYTQPRIVQVMPGAARAAVEYDIWRRQKGEQDVVIVPVGIVYTDKSRYQSRLVVRYGTPINVKAYCDELFAPSTSVTSSMFSSLSSLSANSSINPALSSQESTYSLCLSEKENASATRALTKSIALRIEKALLGLTINAHDWETLYSAGVARDIVFEDEEVPLGYWVFNTQLFVDLLTPSSSISSESLTETKHALIRYFALLHRTGLTHAVLYGLFPLPVTLESTGTFSRSTTPLKHVRDWTDGEWKWYHSATFSQHLRSLRPYSTALKSAALTLAILPVLPLYFPAFIMSHFTARLLAMPGEEEGEAQFRSVGGGVGLGVGLAVGRGVVIQIWRRNGARIWKSISTVVAEGTRGLIARYLDPYISRVSQVMARTSLVQECSSNLLPDLYYSKISNLTSSAFKTLIAQKMTRKLLRGAGWLIAAWCVVKWYSLCIKRAHRVYTYTLAPPARKLWMYHLSTLLTYCSSSTNTLSDADVFEDPDIVPYLALPPPPTNAFIRKREQARVQSDSSNIPRFNPKQRPMITSKLLLALLCAREEARRAVHILVDEAKVLPVHSKEN